jgi:hypothetical protein
MLDLTFDVEKAEPVRFAAAPLLAFTLRLAQATAVEPVPVHAVALRCQLRIEPTRRRYDGGEPERLLDLFGEQHRWGQTLRSMLWTHASVTVPAFSGSTSVDLPVPCSYDFNVAATKYFGALEGGDIPLCLLFSGTIFYEGEDGALQVAPIPWEKEANYRLPVQVWQEMMEHYYPNSAWLCLRKDVFDRLHRYKSRRGLPTWEQALESLLPADESGKP